MPRVGGAVDMRTCGRCSGNVWCDVPPAERVRGSGGTVPTPRIGGTSGVIRGGLTAVAFGLGNAGSGCAGVLQP